MDSPIPTDLHAHGAPNLPQNNINGANKLLSNDREHHSCIRIFKWDAEISIGKPDDDNEIRANGIILLRASIDGSTTNEVVAVPYSLEDMKDRGLIIVLHETLARLHMLESVQSLHWIAYDILLRELCLKFGLSRELIKRYSNDVLVMFFDLKINPASRVIGCGLQSMDDDIKQVCSKRMPHISFLQVNAEVNLETVEKIEECLKVCCGMVVEKSRGMEEVQSYGEIAVSSEENDLDCYICLGSIKVGYRYLITCCGHKFHKVCMAKWLLSRKKRKVSCPVCRNSLYISK